MSGRSLIACMFLFALCVTAGLYTYWNLHTGPFRHLTDTLGQRFQQGQAAVTVGPVLACFVEAMTQQVVQVFD